MNREQIIVRLNHLRNREAHSLTAYALEAEPYVTSEQMFAMKELQDVAAREEARAEALGLQMREALRAAPADRRFPLTVADMNFLALPYVLDLIVRDKAALMSDYESFLAQTAGLTEWAAIRQGVAEAASGARYDHEHLRSLAARLSARSAQGTGN